MHKKNLHRLNFHTGLLLTILALCLPALVVASTKLQKQSHFLDQSLDSPTPSQQYELPPQYTSSRYFQDCLKTVPHSCGCTSLWDSQCNCDERDFLVAEPLPLLTSPSGAPETIDCNCSKMCQEVWNPHDSLSPKWKDVCHVPQVRTYEVILFLTSKGEESISVLENFKKVMQAMGDAIQLKVIYVVSLFGQGKTLRFISKNGPNEVAGDLFGICAMKLYPRPSQYLPFLVCMGQQSSQIPYNAENCTRLHGMRFAAIRDCVNTQKENLLVDHYSVSSYYRVVTAPKVFMDDRLYSPQSTQNYESYEAALCYVFSNPVRPFPWFIFVLIASIFVLLVVLVFVVKQWSNVSLIEAIQSLFVWGPGNQGADTLLYLRAYGYGFPEDDEEGENQEEEEENGEDQEEEDQEEEAEEDDEPISTQENSSPRSDDLRINLEDSVGNRYAPYSSSSEDDSDEESLLRRN